MKTRSGIAGFLSGCFIACLSAGFTITPASAAAGQQPLKIGVVDFREVALSSKAGKAAKARLEKLAEKANKEMEAQQAKLLARRKELESTTSQLASVEQQDRAATLERDEAAFQRLLEDKMEELKNAEMESLQELASRFDGVLKAYAVEKGFSIILETQRPGILYFDKNLDLSTEMIKRFDRTSK